MMTCSYLRDYDTGKLDATIIEWQTSADQLDDQADVLEKQAADIESNWPIGQGPKIAEELRARARAMREQARLEREQIEILKQTSCSIKEAKNDLATADAKDAANTHVQADDLGRVTIPNPDDQTKPDILVQRRDLEHDYFKALDKASRADSKGAEALYRLHGEEPPFTVYPDTGPINLDDASIRDQVANSHQGQLGDCFFLSSLMALAESDPSFVRKNMTWDAGRGVYVVTLYDNFGNGHKIDVRPDEIDARGVRGPNGESNFLSVYEAAYKKSVPGIVQVHTGGVPSGAMMTLTGKQADFSLFNAKGFNEIQQAVDSHPPGAIAVGTKPDLFIDQEKIPYEKRLCPNHAYQVKGFDESGRIILVNPWGDNGSDGKVGYPAEVHLTEEEFRQQTTQTSIART